MAARLTSVRATAAGALALLAAISMWGVGCGSSDDSGGIAGGGAGGSVSKGGSGGLGGSGGITATCSTNADCGSGSFCSAAKTCVPTGGCAVNADCTGGNVCTKSGKCLPPGTCSADGDCPTGEICDPTSKTCVPGGGCGNDQFTLTAVEPNMFISLDRSCSMTGGGGGGQTKWQIAVAAMNQMLTTFQGKIRWGLGLFPDTVTPACQQSAPQFAVADNNEPAIMALLTASLQASDQYYPDGPCVTNIDTAIQQASQEPAFADTTRKSYVLLMTDGAQAVCPNNQGDPLTIQIITQMAQQGIDTFVIGFGSGVKASSLNAFADAGGVPNVDPANPTTHYYQANDQASLQAALGKIAGSVVGCTFTLDSTPPDPSKLYVFFGQTSVARDTTHQSGWDYDSATNQITFYGADCDALKNNQAGTVAVVFGCNQPPPG